jgi:hypothetical protein
MKPLTSFVSIQADCREKERRIIRQESRIVLHELVQAYSVADLHSEPDSNSWALRDHMHESP